jgi:RNA polymerase sigma-54 factor
MPPTGWRRSTPPALADHLLEQLRFLDLGPEDLDRARVICWQLDRRGWLPEPLELLFDQDELAAAQRVWELVRRCDPPGVGARDLRDCLLLQLAREPGDNSFEVAVVQNHLEDLLHNRLPAVAAACGVEIARVEEALQVIARLNPAPGAAFVRGDNQIIIPDVVVERDEHDEWVVSVPDSHLPKIEINQSNYQLLDRRDAPLADRQFFREKMSSARSIIEAVNQRKRTLLRITTEIVKHQQDFLEFGPGHLRPLMRQDIADRIGMHVATVSRAVKDKWIQTPSGAIPLAQFFSGGISTMSGGEAESSRSVKLRIKALIESEDPRRPLSDQAIADRLTREGLDISRRTVTKYRIAENLPSTRQRRSFAGR